MRIYKHAKRAGRWAKSQGRSQQGAEETHGKTEEEIEVSKDVAAANLLWRDQKTAHELELIRIRKRQERDLKAMAAAIRRGDIPPPVWPLAQVLRGSTAPAQIGAHVANVLGRASEDMQAIGASPRLPSQGSGRE